MGAGRKAGCSPGYSAEMEISVAGQAASLLSALAIGALVGVLYDFFRILRARLHLPFLGAVLDLLFWLLVTAALFLHALWVGDGAVRIYYVLAILAGAWLYFMAVSRWALKIGYLLADLVGVVWKIIILPVTILTFLAKKLRAWAKKTFHYGRKWYKIRVLPKQMDEAAHPRGAPGKGGAAHARKKSGASDQAGRAGAAGRQRHRPAQRKKPNPPGGGGAGGHGEPGGPAGPDQRRSGRRRGKQRRP